MSTLFRRSLLAAFPAVAVAPVMPAAGASSTTPDAELVRLCAEHAEVWARIDAMNKGVPHTDDEMTEAGEEWAELAEKIGDLEPTTLAGLHAKAKASKLMTASYREMSHRDADEWLSDLLLEDVLRLTGGAA